jgi:hypothetical protein
VKTNGSVIIEYGDEECGKENVMIWFKAMFQYPIGKNGTGHE